MSAFVCSPEHIAALAVCIRTKFLPKANTAVLAQCLMKANIESVKYRYPNDRDGQRPGPVGLKDRDLVRLAGAIANKYEANDPDMPEFSSKGMISMARCLSYQSCETPSWDTSVECLIVESFVSAMETAPPCRGRDVQWEFTDDRIDWKEV